MKIRGVVLAVLVTLPSCAPDYLDLGYDLPTTTTAKVCTPGESRACYSGPAGTENTGICKGGTQTCVTDGSAFGACLGEVVPKPTEDCATPEDDDCDGVAPTCPGLVLWAANYGDSLIQRALSTTLDPAGNILITGAFYGSIDFGGGPMTATVGGPAEGSDVFVAKVDPDGKPLFNEHYGDWDSQVGSAVASNSAGDIGLAGTFYGTIDFGVSALGPADDQADIFVTKLDGQTGTAQWAVSFPTSPAKPAGLAVAFSADGDLLVAGSFAQTIDFGMGPVAAVGTADLFVARLKGDSGSVQWARTIPGAGAESIQAITASPTGAVVVAGSFNQPLDLDGGVITPTQAQDAFVAGVDGATGSFLWSYPLGGQGDDIGSAVTIKPDGDTLVAGTFGSGAPGLFVAAFGADGKSQWTRSYGDTSDQTAASIAVDTAGDVIVAGSFDGTLTLGANVKSASAGAHDMFVAKLDPMGEGRWIRRLGDSADQRVTGACVNAANEIAVSATFSGSIDTGNKLLVCAGQLDAALLKLAP